MKKLIYLAVVMLMFVSLPALAKQPNNSAFNNWLAIGPLTTSGLCSEPVYVESGMLHTMTQTAMANNGNFHSSTHINLQDVQGVGTDTGDIYDVDLTANIKLSGNVNNGQNHFTTVLNGTLTDTVTYVETSITITIQVNVNANGDTTANVLNISVVCPE